MIEYRQLVLLGVTAASLLTLSACGGSGGTEASSDVSTTRFDGRVYIPAEARMLGKEASAPLLYAIQTQGFETEYDEEQINAPHQNAWERWDLNDYVYDGPYSETRSCAAIAEYQGSGTGSGTVTIVNTLQDNYVGQVEHRYDSCVIGSRAYSGTRRINILEEPRDHPSGRPAAKFQWEYEDFYWGTGGLNYYLDGIIAFEESAEVDAYNYPYQSSSNYTFSRRDGYGYSMRDLVTQCEDQRNEQSNYDYSWRCDIQSGYVGLDELGEFSVETLQPVHQSVWLWGAKLQVSDNDGNRLVFWGEDGQKRATLVDAEARETTYAIEYGSVDMASMDDMERPETDTAIVVVDARFKRWDKELYATRTDEYIFFDRGNSRYVDAIHYSETEAPSERQIDLVEPAYDVDVLFFGHAIMSGHDGSIRTTYLNPAFGSTRRQIGFGKIVGVHDDFAVTYQLPGSSEQRRIMFQWDNTNQLVTETRSLGAAYDDFDLRNGRIATSSGVSVAFKAAAFSDYSSRYVDVGRTRRYLNFLNDNLLVTGGGALIRCTVRCSEDAVYWKSLSEAVVTKFPSEGAQIVVTATTDTEGGNGVAAPSLIVFATVAVSEWGENNYSVPETADTLWVADLNDLSKIKKLELPVYEKSTPKAGLKIRELFNRESDNSIVGVGSWGLASGRDNTVMFSIDLDEVTFD